MRILEPVIAVLATLSAAAALMTPAAAGSAKGSIPAWLRLSLSAGFRPDDGPLAILLEERMVDVSRSRTVSRVREAVKVTSPDGVPLASLKAPQTVAQRFRLKGCWRLRSDQSADVCAKNDIAIDDADDRFTFSLTKVNRFTPAAVRVGDVLAWEYELESDPEASVDRWMFGSVVPTHLSRFGLRIPPGWISRAVVLRYDDLEPIIDDEGYSVWEIRDLPGLEIEASGLPVHDLAPTLILRYGSDGPSTVENDFRGWDEVASWCARVLSKQMVTDGHLRDTARSLTEGSANQLEKVIAVTRLAQRLRYLNVAPGRSVSEAHPAPQVLKNMFGDCEDKTVLAITLLREIGVTAYPLLARTTNLGQVIEEFPTPTAFNHVIFGIDLPELADSASSIEAGALGRLTLFDPTAASTGLGDLPGSLQGTRALACHETGGQMLLLPVPPPEHNSRMADLMVTFPAQGGPRVNAVLSYSGQYAAQQRDHYQRFTGRSAERELLHQLSYAYGGGEVTRLEVGDLEEPSRPLSVTLDLSLPKLGKDLHFLKTMPTDVFIGSRVRPLTEPARQGPFVIPWGFRESTRTTVLPPPGWKVAAPTPSLSSESRFGRYSLTSLVQDDRLVLDRQLTVTAATIAPADYPSLRKFFSEVLRGDSLAVQLVKE